MFSFLHVLFCFFPRDEISRLQNARPVAGEYNHRGHKHHGGCKWLVGFIDLGSIANHPKMAAAPLKTLNQIESAQSYTPATSEVE